MKDIPSEYRGYPVIISDPKEFGAEYNGVIASASLDSRIGSVPVIRVFLPEHLNESILNHEVSHIRLGHTSWSRKAPSREDRWRGESAAEKAASSMESGYY